MYTLWEPFREAPFSKRLLPTAFPNTIFPILHHPPKLKATAGLPRRGSKRLSAMSYAMVRVALFYVGKWRVRTRAMADPVVRGHGSCCHGSPWFVSSRTIRFTWFHVR